MFGSPRVNSLDDANFRKDEIFQMCSRLVIGPTDRPVETGGSRSATEVRRREKLLRELSI